MGAQGVTLTLEPRQEGGGSYLRRIRFSPHLFSEASASAWWAAHKAEVVQAHCLVPSADQGVQADLGSPVVRWVLRAATHTHEIGTSYLELDRRHASVSKSQSTQTHTMQVRHTNIHRWNWISKLEMCSNRRDHIEPGIVRVMWISRDSQDQDHA